MAGNDPALAAAVHDRVTRDNLALFEDANFFGGAVHLYARIGNAPPASDRGKSNCRCRGAWRGQRDVSPYIALSPGQHPENIP